MFTTDDTLYLKNKGITIKNVEAQREALVKGIPFAAVVAAATIDNGIERLSDAEQQKLVAAYNKVLDTIDVVKFVPASGAATRMFKHLVSFLQEFNPEQESIDVYLDKKEQALTKAFFNNFKELPFADHVLKLVETVYPTFNEMSKGSRLLALTEILLKSDGLDYGNMPKGLVPFHKYEDYSTTAFEEQLFEATFFAASNGKVNVHFTVAEQHLDKFKEHYTAIKNRVVSATKTAFEITYSFQKKETDTVAIDKELNFVRTGDGALLLRPSGHGALLSNLNDIDADLIFIKNIDNVVCPKYVSEIAHYKKVLAGKLLVVQKQVFDYLKQLENAVTEEKLAEIKLFISTTLYNTSQPETVDQIKNILNRPLRVCGVVKNTGAPGGGPFWVRKDGEDSLQIVEAAQINTEAISQKQLLDNATHFNPVDLVCGVKDYQGNTFNLHDFKDVDSGFVTQKSYQGKSIKVLELPGLWNGAMAYWNTIFVEVPLATFNPVKTVNDLLKKEHNPMYNG
ncbi:hypothetical protein SCB49_04480 [unidentified eubacterium SCB49]|nr:hypothetical protein SCB49_04480 [unidentified eubacterium SCB49]